MNALEQLCYLQGVALEYIDYYGKNQQIEAQTRYQVLAACGHDIDDHAYVSAQNFKLDAAPWQTPFASMQVTRSSVANFKVRVRDDETEKVCHFEINLDSELCHKQVVDLVHCLEVGEYYIDGVRYVEYQVELPVLAPNYYQVTGTFSTGNERNTGFSFCLVVAPEKCFTLDDDSKVWGISCQLYTLRDKRHNGFGDFSSLKELIQRSSRCGADYILLNPLHKLFNDSPEQASPYSPSDRNQINPLYISPRLCSDFTLPNGEYQSNDSFINYSELAVNKMKCFKGMYLNFCELELAKNTARAEDFLRFAKVHENLNLSQFDCYLQWVAREQLDYCQRYAKQKGMAIGIILDVAVGCSKDGEEYQRNRNLFVEQASIGAPPDPWAIEGQDWGLAVPDPVKVKATDYTHFISLLRANILKGGGLRIDHVMSLLRLWWCVSVDGQKTGSYVYYPFEALLAILSLESHLNQCVIIGEDLGVVPEQIKHSLDTAGIYGNDIFYFEKNHQGEFTAPEAHRKHAMMMVANHDVAPFFAWWQKEDIVTREKYNLYSNPEQQIHDAELRERDKSAILNWLSQDASIHFDKQNVEQVYTAILLRLAGANSQFLSLQLDDLSHEILPVNIPGTDKEYPNWRRRLSKSLSDIFDDYENLGNEKNPASLWQQLNARRRTCP